LFELNEKGEVVAAKYQGCWLLVDDGYLNWSTTIPPMKISFDQQECCWSEWIESTRKDVEYTFGILKGRWQILKAGICLPYIATTDAIWKTCCALHNWLLEVDGRDKKWVHGVPSVWEEGLGRFNPRDQATKEAFALQQFRSQTSIHNYDVSQMGADGNLANDLAANSEDPTCRGMERAPCD
jgi:hypothetical protein